jgi:hypothetical protein
VKKFVLTSCFFIKVKLIPIRQEGNFHQSQSALFQEISWLYYINVKDESRCGGCVLFKMHICTHARYYFFTWLTWEINVIKIIHECFLFLTRLICWFLMLWKIPCKRRINQPFGLCEKKIVISIFALNLIYAIKRYYNNVL